MSPAASTSDEDYVCFDAAAAEGRVIVVSDDDDEDDPLVAFEPKRRKRKFADADANDVSACTTQALECLITKQDDDVGVESLHDRWRTLQGCLIRTCEEFTEFKAGKDKEYTPDDLAEAFFTFGACDDDWLIYIAVDCTKRAQGAYTFENVEAAVDTLWKQHNNKIVAPTKKSRTAKATPFAMRSHHDREKILRDDMAAIPLRLCAECVALINLSFVLMRVSKNVDNDLASWYQSFADDLTDAIRAFDDKAHATVHHKFAALLNELNAFFLIDEFDEL